MKDSDFLSWLLARMENIYKENPNIDYMLVLSKIRDEVKRHEEMR